MGLVNRTAYAATADATTHTVTLGWTPTPGNALRAVGGAPATLTEASGTWTKDATVLSAAEVAVWSKTAAGTETSFVVNLNGPRIAILVIEEWDNLTTVDDEGTRVYSVDTDHGAPSPEITTSTTDEAFVVLCQVSTTPFSAQAVDSWTNGFATDTDLYAPSTAGNEHVWLALGRAKPAAGTVVTVATVHVQPCPQTHAVIAAYAAGPATLRIAGSSTTATASGGLLRLTGLLSGASAQPDASSGTFGRTAFLSGTTATAAASSGVLGRAAVLSGASAGTGSSGGAIGHNGPLTGAPACASASIGTPGRTAYLTGAAASASGAVEALVLRGTCSTTAALTDSRLVRRSRRGTIRRQP